MYQSAAPTQKTSRCTWSYIARACYLESYRLGTFASHANVAIFTTSYHLRVYYIPAPQFMACSSIYILALLVSQARFSLGHERVWLARLMPFRGEGLEGERLNFTTAVVPQVEQVCCESYSRCSSQAVKQAQ